MDGALRRLILRRLAATVLVLLGLTMIVFGLSHATGDPRYLFISPYKKYTAEEWVAQGEALGLNKPLVVQYGLWLGRAVRGDFGESFVTKRNSLDDILEKLPATLQLSGVAIAVSIILGVPLGVFSRGEEGHGLGQPGTEFRTSWAVGPGLLAGVGAHIRLQRRVGTTADVEKGRLVALRPAGHRTRMVSHRGPAAPDTLVDAGSAGQRVRKAGQSEGSQFAANSLETRFQKRAHSAGDLHDDNARELPDLHSGCGDRIPPGPESAGSPSMRLSIPISP